ncbi:hypothetical protein K2173_016499 [Erythroxylum novogranatense]|uniref:BZIP domain-containing protein n=1 Tax=Erythroxylum novogranatense TaxID=1862640 RepID=A0AAV8SGE1_9ROSI|nr:hypothetical protein K2173_016499 [Erythroxylum novogranatense]
MRQDSWYILTLNEAENQLGNLGKPLRSMNLEELRKNVWSTDATESMDMETTSSALPPQRQAILTLARKLSGKTVDQVWQEIQQGQKKSFGEDMKGVFPREWFCLLPLQLAHYQTQQHQAEKECPEALEKNTERKLRRKIKNRESAARSRARKQAYHNELVSNFTSREVNLKLKKEKEFDIRFPSEALHQQKHQLRITSSASF